MGKRLTPTEAADLIERFLDGKERYPQEWNDFIDGLSVEDRVEPYRKTCDHLDSLVNRPDGPDPEAVSEIRNIVSALRRM